MCDRSKAVIPGLLRSMNRLENALDKMKEETVKLKAIQKQEEKARIKAMEKLKEETAKMKWGLICSWIFFVFVVFMML